MYCVFLYFDVYKIDWKSQTKASQILRKLSEVFNERDDNDTHLNFSDSISHVRDFSCVWCDHNYRKPFPDKDEKYMHQRQDIDAHRARIPLDIYNSSPDWKFLSINQMGGM